MTYEGAVADRAMTKQRVLLLRGIAAVGFGVMALLLYGLSARTLAVVFGVYVAASGVGVLVGAGRWLDDGAARGPYILLGLISVMAGVTAFAWPDITPAELAAVVGVWALGTGAVDAWLAAGGRGRWTAPLVGVLLAVAGAMVFFLPSLADGAAIALVIGAYSILTGMLLLTEVRRRQQPDYQPRHRAVPAGG